MKRLLAAALSMVMVVSAANLPAFAVEGPAKIADAVGDFTAAVRLDYPESIQNIEGKKFRLELADDANKTISLDLKAEKETKPSTFDGKSVEVTVTPLNEQNVEITTENTVGYFEVAFQGLPNNKRYTVSLKANGYSSYRSEPIELNAYSRKVLVGSWEGGFALGDVTGDGVINQKDLNSVRENLGKTGSKGDITLDNLVDIEDLALVHINQGAKGQAVLFETAAIVSAVTSMEEIEQALADAGVEVDGNLENLFVPNGKTVTLTPKAGEMLVLPFSFEKNPIETQEIQITSPQGTGSIEAGTATVEYVDENGDTKTEKFSFAAPTAPQGVHAIGRNSGSNTLVINLGKRVAVKKVTIQVSKVQGEPGYAVVENIQFLKDIVPENPEITNSVPMRVIASAGSGEAVVSWKAVDNVDGYIVRWGEQPGAYTKELRVSQTKAEITGLENLKTYYFAVQAYTEDGWKGGLSQEVSAVPQPNKVPPAPDYLTVAPQDRALTVSWKKTKDALSYNLYYKETAQAQNAYKKVDAQITATSYALGGLENGVSYDIYVTAKNNIGEGPRSLTAQGVPEKQVIEGPTLPETDRIPNSAITKIEMKDPSNVDTSQYPNGFDVNFVADGDYATHWTASTWSRSHRWIFEFDEEKSMSYLIYVPRLDGNYPKSLNRYTITAVDASGNRYNLTRDNGSVNAGPAINKSTMETDGYVVLPFERNDHIKKLEVEVNQWEGSPTDVSLSEIAFYKYNGMEDEIDALFADSSKTRLSQTATKETINRLQERLAETGSYYIDKDVLQDELNLAKELLAGNNQALGLVKEGLFSISTEGDVRGFSTLQPLGAVGAAGQTVAIYASIPEGETVSLIPTQYYSEVNGWRGAPITLKNGRNIIKIPTLTSLATEKGGSLYLEYSGSNGNEIKLHVRGKGATAIPTLELYNWNSLTESQIRAKITAYTEELNRYTAGLKPEGIQTNIRNATEISLPGVLLSLPADTVQRGTSANATQKEQEERLYQNALAWEQMMDLMYKTHGVDNPEQQKSRNNIRYHRMFAGAFMYAAGAHIGVGYGSTSGLVLGRPVDPQTGEGSLYGWGIAHEIGHNMDTLGHAEITNNIYALVAQTYDGNNNTKTSRLEASNKYPRVFDKTSSGAKGLANDVFTQLAMYWQLHLAYDGPQDNFYNKINKAYREGAGVGFAGDEKFAVVASQVANKDLTEFFTQWGVELSDAAKGEMGKKDKETRKIHYLSDESRRQRLDGTTGATGTVSITASAEEKEVTVTISPNISGEMQGYEILRNGRPHAFVPAGEKSLTFTEIIGSSNNKTLEYQVRAIDILGNVAAESAVQEVSISHNNEVDRSLWTAETQEDGTLMVRFTDPVRVSGIVFKNMDKLEDGGQAEVTPPVQQPEAGSAEDKAEEKTEETPSSSLPENTGAEAEAKEPAGEALTEENSGEGQEAMKAGDSLEKEPPEDGGEEPASQNGPESKAESNGESGAEAARLAQGQVVIEVKEEGKGFANALTIDLEETDLANPKNALQLFNGGYTNGRVQIFENAVEIRIAGLPESVTESNLDFAGYPGDSIEFMEGAIGRLAHSYQYGDETQVIPKGTLVIVGAYRGDPVYSTIRIKGEFTLGDPSEETAQTEERPINGEVYLFAEIPEAGKLSEINNGLWIFVPDIQAEKELQENQCNVSVLPGRIKAELYRTDDPQNASSKRLTSDTKWISSPTEETMPSITLQGE